MNCSNNFSIANILMTKDIRQRGRIYLIVCMSTMILFHVWVRYFLQSPKGIGIGAVGASVVMVVTWVSVWRGSGFAYKFLLFGFWMTAVYLALSSSEYSQSALPFIVFLLAMWAALLLAPATRAFLASQKEIHAPKEIQGDAANSAG